MYIIFYHYKNAIDITYFYQKYFILFDFHLYHTKSQFIYIDMILFIF